MARKRYISTDVSIDTKLNRVSELAALLYSWMLPHAADNCRLSAKNAEELRLSVMPGRRRTDDEVEAAVDELIEYELVGRDADGRYYFPAESFYKYQTYIKPGNRAKTPPENTGKHRKTPEISGEHRKTPENTGDQRETPESTVSLPLPLSLSHSEETACAVSSARARVELTLVKAGDDLGLGERHPANIIGDWNLWQNYERFLRSKGKRQSVFSLEAVGQQLSQFKLTGSDPRAVVLKNLANEWVNLHDLDDDEKKPPGIEDDSAVLKRIESIAKGSG